MGRHCSPNVTDVSVDVVRDSELRLYLDVASNLRDQMRDAPWWPKAVGA
jgi:hypothetical protein